MEESAQLSLGKACCMKYDGEKNAYLALNFEEMSIDIFQSQMKLRIIFRKKIEAVEILLALIIKGQNLKR